MSQGAGPYRFEGLELWVLPRFDFSPELLGREGMELKASWIFLVVGVWCLKLFLFAQGCRASTLPTRTRQARLHTIQARLW